MNKKKYEQPEAHIYSVTSVNALLADSSHEGEDTGETGDGSEAATKEPNIWVWMDED